ncbi:MAG: metal-dependent hydrolase, partial [Gemmatimonadetes bacterium]|nr:metal-dependent hydrolase [Gemmatimonadota bacterium]
MSMRVRSSLGARSNPRSSKRSISRWQSSGVQTSGSRIAGISARAKARSGSAPSSGPMGRHNALAAFSSYVVILCKSKTPMDSVTQIALGAAVGEKVLGKKVGNKAPLWGAALGILPDLDVLGAAFLSETDLLGFHRWVSHSLLFAVGGGLGLGWALSKLHRDASWREWFTLAFWAILTHALLDCFTGYGTQLFSPFSNYPVAFSAIFIIDPLYTLPLAIGLIAALCQRRLHWRRRLNTLGLGLSTAYLIVTAAICLHVHSTFAQALDDQGIPYERLHVVPTPFNAVLWSGLAGADDHLWAGLYSLLDDDSAILFRRIERNTHLIAPRRDDPP